MHNDHHPNRLSAQWMDDKSRYIIEKLRWALIGSNYYYYEEMVMQFDTAYILGTEIPFFRKRLKNRQRASERMQCININYLEF